MFSILLVDDERASIEGLRQRVDWALLGIGPVRGATSAAQARRVFTRTPADLLLCDIEMPQESGISLLDWVRERFPETVSIILTCHADFSYAKQVVRLGAFDYLLKPAAIGEVERVLAAAVKRREELRMQKTYGQYGENWIRNRDTVEEAFWRELVFSPGPLRHERALELARARNLSMEEENYVPVLVVLRGRDSLLSGWNLNDLDYAVKNMLQELFAEKNRRPAVVPLDIHRRLLLLSAGAAPNTYGFQEAGHRFIEVFHEHFGGSACFYCGSPSPLQRLPEVFRALERMDADNVSYEGRVFFACEQAPHSKPGVLPEKQWRALLLAGRAEEVCGGIRSYLQEAVAQHRMNAEILAAFYQSFLQIVYAVLAEKQLPGGPELGRAVRDAGALASVEKASERLQEIARMAAESGTPEGDDSAVEKAKIYVADHIGENITRGDIAQAVFLNPNYLSRLFHGKTGKNLTDYIAEQKIEIARRMLAQTDLTASEIAHRLGYDNLPYFCRVFKRETGFAPMEFRHHTRGNGVTDRSGPSQ